MSSFAKANLLRPDCGAATRHFPGAILAAGLTTAWALVDTLGGQHLPRLPVHREDILPALILAFLAATAAALATSRSPSWIRWAGQGAGLIFGVSLPFWVEFGSYTTLPLFGVMVCFISVSAGIAARHGTSGFWFANARLSASLAIGLVALGIVLVGSLIVLYTAEILLAVEPDKVKDVLASVFSFLIFPLFWLALAAPVAAEPVEEQSDDVLLRIVSVTTDALLIPLMLAFGAVIHVYAARIALMGELPKGQIGWIVPVYLVAGYGTHLLAHAPQVQFARVREAFRRFWLASTLVPMALLALATAIRVRTYGVTEERYWLMLVVIGAGLLALSATIRRPFDIRLVPLTGGILALVAAFGPLSAKNISISSQAARAKAILASVPPERWAASKDGGLSEEQKRSLYAALGYLHHQDPSLAMLASVWPAQLPKGWEEMGERLVPNRPVTSLFFAGSEVIQLETITILEKISIGFERTDLQTIKGDSTTFMLALKGHILEVASEAGTTRFDVSSLLNDRDGPPKSRPTLRSVDGRRGDLIPLHLEWEPMPLGPSLKYLSATIVLY